MLTFIHIVILIGIINAISKQPQTASDTPKHTEMTIEAQGPQRQFEDFSAMTKGQLMQRFPELRPSWTKKKMLSVIAA